MHYIFYLPAILFLASGFPQMFKLLRTKSSGDISTLMFVLACIAIIIVAIDAYIHDNNSILVSSLASLSITSINTFLIIKYKKK